MLNQRRIFKSSGLTSAPSAEEAAAALPRIDSHMAVEGKPCLVPIALIKPSPHQTSPICEQKVKELVDNLCKNPLSSPIVLRRDSTGNLELIAGRHRVEAYRRLGRSEIEATLRDLSDDDAEKLVFYDNLFAPSMTDFQKYLGFSQRKARRGLTQAQLAEESGVNPATVSRLMAFDGLPESVMSILMEVPHAISLSVAVEFVSLAEQNPDLAIDAVTAIGIGEMTQKAAMAWLRAGGKKEEAPKPEQFKAMIKSGKQKYAELVRRADKLVISLNADDKTIHEDLQAWLKNRAIAHFQ